MKIETVKDAILEYIKNGGSIYDERRKLPYYEKLHSLVKQERRKGNLDFDYADAYNLAGFEFDREFNEYMELIYELRNFADKDNYVDKIKNLTGKDNVRTALNILATSLKCSPSDYLILMTNFRFKKAIIKTDYILELYREIKEAYPSLDITGIKANHPHLYHKLTHILKYSKEFNSMAELIDAMGFTGSKFLNTTSYHNVNENFIEKELKEKLKETKNIKEVFKLYPNLYSKTLRCALLNDQSMEDWLKERAIDYQSENVKKFAKYRVDSDKREDELLKIQSSIRHSLHLNDATTPLQLYYQKKLIATKTLQVAEDIRQK